jgi:S-formylglutathione hydrolase FrmB
VLKRGRLAIVAALVVAAAVLLLLLRHSAAQHGASVQSFFVRSHRLGMRLPAVAVAPAGGGGGRTLLVFLHGHGGDPTTYLDDAFFSALAALGPRAPDVVFPEGGDFYWHDRESGQWGSYVIDDVIPQALALLHADPRRVAIGGISMGGFGALDLARLHPGRFCAVGGHSPAIFPAAAYTAPGAFDDPADFARHDLLAAARAGNPFGATPVWIDAGTADPFLPYTTRLAQELHADGAHVHFSTRPGAHTITYWDRNWSRYLHFYVSHCGP